MATELRIITKNHDGRVLTNNNIWTPDSRCLMYDTRSDRLGDIFDSTRIMQVDVKTGEEQCVYFSKHGAGCGVVTTHPFDDRYVFIAGPENPTSDWMYGPTHRQGMIGQRSAPYTSHPMDARELAERPVVGALRGGTHVHMWHPKGDWLRSTYNDAFVSPNVRDIAVHIPGTVDVPSTHARNHSGTYHSFIVTDTVVTPTSQDHITRAYEETWLGSSRQIAFMADTVVNGDALTELFLVDTAPLTLASSHSFDHANRIKPPAGITQRRLTRFAETDLRIVKTAALAGDIPGWLHNCASLAKQKQSTSALYARRSNPKTNAANIRRQWYHYSHFVEQGRRLDCIRLSNSSECP
ncbi:MAG: hypothetical protein RLZ42_247 [Armatimonadota bacterium]